MATPTVVQGKSGFAGAGVLTYSVTLDAPAGAGHIVILCAGGDKDIGAPFALDQTGTVSVDLRSTSVSQVVAWYETGAGGQTVISGDVAANIAGANLFALELEQDSDVGTWAVQAIATANSTEANVTTQSTGTTGAAAADGLAVATFSCDSVNTAGTASYSNGYTNLFASGNGSTQSGLWVATLAVADGATTECTLTRTGGTADQHSGSVVVFGKTIGAGVPFLTADLGAGASIAVEIAWGADLTASEDTWTWTDVTTDVRVDPGISTTLGRGDEASVSQPATLQLVLDNSSSDYSRGGHSSNWPYVRRNTPVRVTIDPDDGDGVRTVVLAFADGWAPGWDALIGTIPVVTLNASGTLRRIAQGDAPLASALRRALTDTASVVTYWPCEDGKNSTFAPDVRGGPSMTFTGQPKFAADAPFDCSGELVEAGTGIFAGDVAAYDTSSNEHQVRLLIVVPEDGLPDETVLLRVNLSGTAGRFDVTYESSGTGNLSLQVYNANGTLFSDSGDVTMDMNGKPRRLSLELTQDGADIDWAVGVVQPVDLGAGYFTGTAAARTIGAVTQVELFPAGTGDDTLFGHVSVQNDITSLFESVGAFRAHIGEFPSSGTASVSRMTRLCTENGVALTRHTGPGSLENEDRMGPQLVESLLTLLRECETADQGQIWDGRTNGLVFTTRRYREVGTIALTIDVGGDELGAGFAPTDDDQRALNKCAGRRTTGVTAVYEDTDGPLGTATVGIYDGSIEVNTALDVMALQYAAWLVALGTVDGYRIPTVAVDLRATPDLAGAVLDVIPGDRLQLVDADDTLSAFPPGAVDLIVEGISHEISSTRWVATFQCSPFTTWGTAEMADETGDTSELLWRPDTDGSTLAADYAAGITSISVTTPSGPLWTTVADDYPLVLSIGGYPVRATACSGASSPQTMTVDALPVARSSGDPVALYDPRPLAL